MTQSTIPSATSNNSNEKADDLNDTFAAWRNLAYTLEKTSYSASIDDETAFPSGDSMRMSTRYNQSGPSVFEQARVGLAQKKTAAIRSAFEAVNERRSNPPTGPSAGITGMDKWEGTVTEVDDEFFTVHLSPHNDGTAITADFPRDLISDDDLRIGDVVYVTVRTIQSIGGPKRTSAVRLRRLGRWTEAEIDSQKARAKLRHSRLQSKFA